MFASGAAEMARWVKALAIKPDNLSSILELTWWEERTGSCPLTSTCGLWCVCTRVHSHTEIHWEELVWFFTKTHIYNQKVERRPYFVKSETPKSTVLKWKPLLTVNRLLTACISIQKKWFMELKFQIFIHWFNQIVHVQSVDNGKTMVRRSWP